MKLDDVDGSGFEIEDRRGRGSGGRSAGGGLGGLGAILGGMGAKAGIPAVIVVVVITLLANMGGGGSGGTGAIDDVLGQLSGEQPTSQQAPTNAGATKDEAYEFVGDVGSLLEFFWAETFAASNKAFEPASLVIFDSATDTGGCGVGQPEAGPFYCPPSQKMFIDFGFYERLEEELGFNGDFAMAYVLAHEYGHHVQNLLGINDKVREAQQGASRAEANALSVKLELQADCFAGVWAKSAFERLEPGDIDEALNAARAVGDDAIQGSNANQESFTHGTSRQRKQWFTTGLESGDPSACDTFA